MCSAHYIGFDLSTQQLKGLIVSSDLKKVHEAKVDFDADFSGKYGIKKGVLTNPDLGEVYAPVAMWLDALDLVLQRLKDDGADFSRIKGASGAGMQHGTVFWSTDAEELLTRLDPSKDLASQLKRAFAQQNSPNWQDASTQEQCDLFDAALGDEQTLADVTGSKAHHRFSGPQILRFRQRSPDAYKATSRISLVSSFLASILAGKVVPIDIGDVCGMNLREIKAGKWNEDLVKLVAGDSEGVEDLKAKLGPIPEDGGEHFGTVSPYFVQKFGFNPDCTIVACTGDNPSTLLSQPLREGDAIVSLGTSTTFLMSTASYLPHPSYHFMNHPTTAGLYMFMLCYKNGGLAREQVRNELNEKGGHKAPKDIWQAFDQAALATHPLCQKDKQGPMRLGLYFPRPEIVPNVQAGEWEFSYDSATARLADLPSSSMSPEERARSIVESQFLSLRHRSKNLVKPQLSSNGKQLPAQPRRIYLVGGGSVNATIQRICGEVLGGLEGIYQLDVGGNACALGAAYKAVWAIERKKDEKFEELISARWREEEFIKKVDDGYREGVFETYGAALPGFAKMEEEVIRRASNKASNGA